MSAPPPAPPAEEAPPPPPPDPIIARLSELLADPIIDSVESADCLTLAVDRERLLEVLAALRDDPQLTFGHLSDVTAVDFLDMDREPVAVPLHLEGPLRTFRRLVDEGCNTRIDTARHLVCRRRRRRVLSQHFNHHALTHKTGKRPIFKAGRGDDVDAELAADDRTRKQIKRGRQ